MTNFLLDCDKLMKIILKRLCLDPEPNKLPDPHVQEEADKTYAPYHHLNLPAMQTILQIKSDDVGCDKKHKLKKKITI